MYGYCVFNLLTCRAISAGLPEGGENSGENHRDQSPRDQQHLHHPLSASCAWHPAGSAPPCTSLIPPAAFWEEIQVNLRRNRQTGPQPLPPGSESAERTLLVLGYASMKRLEKISRRHMNSLLYGNDKKVLNLESSDICHYLYPAFSLAGTYQRGVLVTWLPQHCQKCQVCTCATNTFSVQSRLKWRNVSLRQLVFTAVK